MKSKTAVFVAAVGILVVVAVAERVMAIPVWYVDWSASGAIMTIADLVVE